MDKTKSKLAAFFDNDEEDTSFLSKPVDDAKLSHYTSGTLRKSRREKEQEAADAKQREEEENAAQAYAEFLDAFEGEEVARRKIGSGFVKADSKAAYIPSMPAADRAKFIILKMHARPQESLKGRLRLHLHLLQNRKEREPWTVFWKKSKGKLPRLIPLIRLTRKNNREQAEREAKYSRHSHGRSATAMAAYEGQSGSKDRGDPQTTNLFVANLPPSVTEPSLGKFFAKAGPVGSVKIMWPRADASFGPGADLTAARKAKGSGLNGFVSYMTRRDAEDALREFDGHEWQGSVLRVGWSKAVPIAAKPIYGIAVVAVLPQIAIVLFLAKDTDLEVTQEIEIALEVLVDEDRRAIQEDIAELKGHDERYDGVLREFEKNNPKYAFMLKRDHRRHAFYRGLLESKDKSKPAFDDDGYNSVYSTDPEEDVEREQTKKNALGKLARQRFEAMLRAMSGKRGELARCMTFCLEHAEAAHEVADIIVSSLLVEGTAVPRKVARLHLICDILHNSAAAVPSAWKFRQEFQARLGIVFDHLANIYHSFPGRITADIFKKQITTVVDIWEDWIVFPPDFTSELRLRLEGAIIASEEAVSEVALVVPSTETKFVSKFKTSTFQLAKDEPVTSLRVDSSDGEPMDVSSDDGNAEDLDGEPVEDIDIDGVPVDDDIDGEPVNISAHAMTNDDLDGQFIGDDIDGVPVDEDIDGIPLDADS
ncbi:hypothetical protein CPB83DRAFT_886523 [Crepidotus variabilis]|uniref:U2 snRNP-associated SURP motif-containing protein n=1 Tax=Crepidotus variabilis TaxID=179855 RepID=A0A9P6JK91_9AGAR|nr:hypothetical protein CPB83DRAFT_886523 [Crepidotus variabilis]